MRQESDRTITTALGRLARLTRLPVLAAGVAAPVAASAQSTPLPTELALSTFDAAWEIVYETHFDTTFNGVDWPGLKAELRPRIEDGTSEEELRETVAEMLGRLGQSHFGLIPREVADTLDPATGPAERGDPGLDVRLIGDEVVVSRVDEDGAAWRAGVRPGWVVVAVGTDSVGSIIRSARLTAEAGPIGPGFLVRNGVVGRLQGAPGTKQSLTLLDGEDSEREVEIELLPTSGLPVKLGNLPTIFAAFDSEGVSRGDVRTGWIWFNSWMVPLVRRIDVAVDEYRDLDGIVLDLRGNGGGVAAMVSGVAGHFLDEPLSLGIFKTRTTTLDIKANPRRVNPDGQRVEPYAGPLAILVDGQSASASEVFAGGLQSIGRARIFGRTTVGAVLPARMDRLPNGDVLYHAFAEFITAEGVTLEARGVVPDEEVPLTREDLLKGRDATLEAALKWIADSVTADSDR